MPPRPRSLPHINRLRNLQTPTLRLIAPRSRISQRSFATHVETPGFIGRPPPGTTTPAAKPSEPKGVAEIGPLPEYRRRIALGLLKPDQEQLRAVVRLQKLCEDLLDYSPPEIKPFSGKPLWQRGFKVFGRDGGMQKLTENAFAGKSIIPVLIDGEEPDYIGPRGLWIHGEVGTGKTLLLDLFHASMPTALKHRLHFHHLVSSIHAKLRDWSNLPMDSAARQSDAHVTMAIAREMVAEGWLLCFDEFQVTDVATAVIVRQVLAGMFRLGAVMVVTSNRAPDELYQGGFQRSVYAPFIDLIKERCDVVHVRSETDYRAVMAEERPPPQKEQVYFVLDDEKGKQKYIERVMGLFRNDDVKKKTFTVYGRTVTIPKATDDGKAIFAFDDLCGSSENPMGPVDYLELCSRYHTLVVQNVPIMGLAQKNEARRFITFLDAAYENKVKVIMSADDVPDKLFVTEPEKSGDGATPEESSDAVMHREMLGDLLGGFELVKGVEGEDGVNTDIRKLAIFTGSDERFAFKRAVSRIKEMGSEGYLSGRHEPQKLDWSGLERVRGVEGAEDVAEDVEERRRREEKERWRVEGAERAKLEGTGRLEGIVEDAVAVVGEDVPRGVKVGEVGGDMAYGDDFGDEAGYRGMVVRMQHRLGEVHGVGKEKEEGLGGRILRTMKMRQEGQPKVQETHFWGMVPKGRVAAFWSNLSTEKKTEGQDVDGIKEPPKEGAGLKKKIDKN